RLTAAGVLDTAFGSGGVVKFVDPSYNLGALTLDLMPDGKIRVGYLAYETFYYSYSKSRFALLDDTGTLDPSYGRAGVKESGFLSTHGSYFPAAKSGLLYVTTDNYPTVVRLRRYDADLQLDPGFVNIDAAVQVDGPMLNLEGAVQREDGRI